MCRQTRSGVDYVLLSFPEMVYWCIAEHVRSADLAVLWCCSFCFFWFVFSRIGSPDLFEISYLEKKSFGRFLSFLFFPLSIKSDFAMPGQIMTPHATLNHLVENINGSKRTKDNNVVFNYCLDVVRYICFVWTLNFDFRAASVLRAAAASMDLQEVGNHSQAADLVPAEPDPAGSNGDGCGPMSCVACEGEPWIQSYTAQPTNQNHRLVSNNLETN